LPELPEVETIRLSLEDKIKGLQIEQVEVLMPKIIKMPDTIEDFKERVQGKTIKGLSRRGKYLLLHLSQENLLVLHLRMTGRFLYVAQYEEITKHTHVVFCLNNGYQLRFIDIRQFGTIYLLKENEFNSIKGLHNLGPEPLGENFTKEGLTEALAKKNKKIKQVLLDQDVVAGLGNIYADEVLFEAHILPERTASSLTVNEIQALYYSILKVLKEAICHRGTSFRDYVDSGGQKGEHQNHLKVYQRQGQECSRCCCQLKKEKIAGRSSHYCPGCQH